MQIYKVFNYCWFGGKSKPESVIKCIETWKKYCPNYEIKEWNESNFDINSCDYTKKAYNDKKYAFVSDYARYKILYEHGGIYLDTDVEIIKCLDDLLNSEFLGFESSKDVAPGLIMAFCAKNEFCKELLEKYESILYDNVSYKETIVNFTTSVLLKYGLRQDNTLQNINGITIYPMEYFNPKGANYGKTVITEKTYSIHHYDASWKNPTDKLLMRYRQKFGKRKGILLFIIMHPILSIKKRKEKK